ncbi:MAG: phosphoribosylformylglycinamidine synthase subunit PurL [Firmicutes bacterium]|jgi:phosphoribosylformylglycinamidine synthase|nr:phosphoribosylformylglycinamidine synthase subunit PurL [Bacillota bacterium]
MAGEDRAGPEREPTCEQIVGRKLWRGMGLKDFEFERIRGLLGRSPNWTELGMFAVLWSEHCAYKHSRAVLRTLPTSGPGVLVGPGENAGVVDIGDGLAVAFKMESHNHPSAVEPYQGAATGVGGIIRDILAMGARPIALVDPLRFGELSDMKVRRLFAGVVAGIAGYGNCVGIPTVGGEVAFEDCYADNPLCNVMCVGLIERGAIKRGVAAGVGNSVMLVGHLTGRDGIHGATFASEELGEDSESKRPNVQVGDPFYEKLLIEACLEMMSTGRVVGIQDMGAAGITSSCAETAARAGTGIEIDVAKVPLRERRMSPYEIMLSESQERMLVIVERGGEDGVAAVCRKWGLPCSAIGRVTGDGMFRVLDRGAVRAEVPASVLVNEAPVLEPGWEEPAYLAGARSFDHRSVPVPGDMENAFRTVLASPSIASKAWVYRQYDHMVQTNTVVLPGADAAVIRIRNEGGRPEKGLALKADGNGRYCYLDPVTGGRIAVAEAARNVACVGARPLAITDCLNFGNPEKPDVFWQFRGVIEGIREACEALGTPVTGGNVSFYNESRNRAIYPTPIVGMVGLMDDASKATTPGFKAEGDLIVLLGETIDELGGTEYLKRVHGMVAGKPPSIDLRREKALIEVLVEACSSGILGSAHDISDGGLAVALAECCFFGLPGARGADVTIPWVGRADSLLFSETQSRAVVTVRPGMERELADICRSKGVPYTAIGRVGGRRLRIAATGVGVLIDAYTADVERLWLEVIPCLMNG